MGQRLWCTYYGGDPSFFISVKWLPRSHNRYRVDALNNNIYVSGVTNSNNNISTPGAYKEKSGSRWCWCIYCQIQMESDNGEPIMGSDEFQGVDKCEK
jgi:hypothetical protein